MLVAIACPTVQPLGMHATASLGDFISDCGWWSASESRAVMRKLRSVGVKTVGELIDSVTAGSINQRLKDAGFKTFTKQSMVDLRYEITRISALAGPSSAELVEALATRVVYPKGEDSTKLVEENLENIGGATFVEKPESTIRLYVSGLAGNIFECDVPERSTVLQAKRALAFVTNIPRCFQQLLHGDTILNNSDRIADLRSNPQAAFICVTMLLQVLPKRLYFYSYDDVPLSRVSEVILDQIRAFTNDQDVGVRLAVANFFANQFIRSNTLVDERSIAAVSTCLEDESDEVRFSATAALLAAFEKGSQQAAATVQQLAEAEHPEISEAAQWILAHAQLPSQRTLKRER